MKELRLDLETVIATEAATTDATGIQEPGRDH
jgi:hypothetical protein